MKEDLLPMVRPESLEEIQRLGAELPYAAWADALRYLCNRCDSNLWLIGELIRVGEGLYGEKYKGALETTKLQAGTLYTITCVCRKMDISRRREKLSFWYHAEVALVKELTPKEQDKFLKLAEENEWTQSELRQAIRKAKATECDEAHAGAATCFVLSKHVGDITRWLRVQLEDTPIDKMPRARREALTRELRPIVDVYEALRGGRTPFKESISRQKPHR